MQAVNDDLSNKAVRGTFWAMLDRFGSMGLQFLVNLVLARTLIPEDFGVIGMLMIFIAVSNVFVDGGFGSALLQKKKPSQKDYSTIFLWNLALGVLCYIIIFACAPFVEEFYGMDDLAAVLRGMGLTLIFNALLAVQCNRLQKQLQFGLLASSNIIAFTIAAAVAIAMAFHGAGVWSLVELMVGAAMIRILLLYAMTRWLPVGGFSRESFKGLFSFGCYLFFANLLQELCSNIQGVVIGKKFSATDLGYFTQAKKLDTIMSYSVPQVIVSVMYPVYSQFQDELQRLCNLVMMNMRVVGFFIFPILAVLILVADPLILFLYGDRWVDSVPYFRIMCVGGFATCLNNLAYYAVIGVGQSKAQFYASFWKWGILLILLFVSCQIGMVMVVWGLTMSTFNILLTNVWLCRKYIGLSVRKLVGVMLPLLMLNTVCMGLCYLLINVLCFNWVVTATLYALIYVGGAYAFRLKALEDAKVVLEKMVKGKR